MKQNILTSQITSAWRSATNREADHAECLGWFVLRWAFFGLGMWWIWSAFGWSHGIAWVIGLVMAFSMVRKEFEA